LLGTGSQSSRCSRKGNLASKDVDMLASGTKDYLSAPQGFAQFKETKDSTVQLFAVAK